MTLNKKIHQKAVQAGVCGDYADMLLRAGSKRTLVDMFLLSGSADFCLGKGILDADILREFKGEPYLRGKNIYIDEKVTLHNARRVFLLGKTYAHLHYDDGSEARHEVFVGAEAEADIYADNWAVVFVKNGGGRVHTNVSNNAIVL